MTRPPLKQGAAHVFIGSSTEGLRIAEAIHDGLEKCIWEGRKLCRVEIWDETFSPSDIVIDRLLVNSRVYDYAILVVTPDDIQISRGTKHQSPRDNINLEIGIFMANLGRRHCIVVRPGNEKVKLPSDLLGLCTVNYEYTSNNPDPAELRPTVNTIRLHIERTGLRDFLGDYIDSYGFSYKLKNFGVALREDAIRPYGNGSTQLILACATGDRSKVHSSPHFALSEPWTVPRSIPKDPQLVTDCSPILSQIKDEDTVWGLLFILPKAINIKKIKCINDILVQGGRALDGRGNMANLES